VDISALLEAACIIDAAIYELCWPDCLLYGEYCFFEGHKMYAKRDEFHHYADASLLFCCRVRPVFYTQ